jgi:hypothetical protein
MSTFAEKAKRVIRHQMRQSGGTRTVPVCGATLRALSYLEEMEQDGEVECVSRANGEVTYRLKEQP